MGYDKKLLESWTEMPDWGTYLIQNGALNKYSSKEGFQFLQNEYYAEVKRRISYCKELLKEHKDTFLYYVTAELYDRCNEDEHFVYLFKCPVKAYCLRALDIDPNFAPAKKLLQKVHEWLEFLDGGKRGDAMPDFDVGFGET